MARRLWKHLVAASFCAVALFTPLTVGADIGPAPGDSGAVVAQSDVASISARLVELTNQTRAKAGLTPLTPVNYLTNAATGHSQEMMALNYFSHTSPTPGRTQPKMRIQRANGWDTRVGENIYRAQGVPASVLADRAMAAWLKSPSHYKNLMDPSFNSVGIGIVPSGDQFTITQNFSRQTIVVKGVNSTPGSAGYELVFQGKIREGSPEGAVFVNDAFKETFTADANGVFTVRTSGPAGSQVSLSQKKPNSSSYAQNLTLPIEAGLR